MPRNITLHDALIINKWWAAGITRPTVEGMVSSVRRAPPRVLEFIPGYRQVVDRLDATKYQEQQSRLQRLGGVAAVDVSSPIEPSRSQARRDRVVSVLQESRIIEQGRIVAVQPIMYSTARREQQRSLTSRARALSKAIDARKPRGETLFNSQPIVVDSQRAEIGLYEAINEAAIDLEEIAQELRGKEKNVYVPAPSLVVAMTGVHIVRTLRGPTYDDVARSGVAVLHEVSSLPKDNLWLPWAIPSPTSHLEPEEEAPLPLGVSSAHVLPEPVKPYTEVYW